MNKKQALSLFRSVQKVTKRHCGACGKRREFSIVEEKKDGAKRWFVKIVCECSTMTFKDFDR